MVCNEIWVPVRYGDSHLLKNPKISLANEVNSKSHKDRWMHAQFFESIGDTIRRKEYCGLLMGSSELYRVVLL